MKISIIGINDNELASGRDLAEMGNEIIYVCKDDRRIDNIRRGYYSQNEEKILKNFRKKDKINFTADLREALNSSNMCFISENEECKGQSLFYILSNAKEVGANMTNHTFIVDRSPIAVNRYKEIKDTVQSELDKRASNLTFEVISNPNFLRA